MFSTLNRFLREQDGATMIEYAIMASLIAMVVIISVALLGDSVVSLFQNANSTWDNAKP